jgi:hypothetical protein
MTHEQAFALAFAKYGRQVEGAFGHDMRELIHSCQAEAGGAYFGITESLRVNAIATMVDDLELITFFAGLPVFLFNVCNAFLSDPSVLTSTGDTTKESASTDMAAILRPEYMTIGAPPLLPKCKLRAEYARAMASSAQAFLLFHERSHIELGHLGFLRSNLGALELEECSAYVEDAPHAEVLRALEIDADNGAAFTSLAMWREYWKAAPPADLCDTDRDTLWLLSIFFVFAALEISRPGLVDSTRATHPSPWVRVVCIWQALDSPNVSEVNSIEPFAGARTTGGTIGEAMRWISSNVRLSDGRRWIFKNLSGKEVISERNPCLLKVNELAPMLDKHRRQRCERLGIRFLDWRTPHVVRS